VPVSLEDVRHIAALARLALDDERVEALAAELNTILEHVDVLARVDTDGVQESIGVRARAQPLRKDTGPPTPLARSVDTIAPRMRDGFFLVPRLASHETPETE